MFKTAKKLKKLSCIKTKEDMPKSDEFGRTVVDISVSESSELFSPLSIRNEPILSHETAEFFSHSIKHTKRNAEIKLVVSASHNAEISQAKLKRAIRNYYIQEFSEANYDLKRNSALTSIMTIIGILVFAATLLLTHFSVFELITTVLDVVAWVFVWEAVDIFFFRRAELKLKKLRSAQLLTAEIEVVNGE